MFGFKGNKAVVQVVKSEAIAPSELAFASAWGFTYTAWTLLTIEERKDYRDRVAYAPYSNSERVSN